MAKFLDLKYLVVGLFIMIIAITLIVLGFSFGLYSFKISGGILLAVFLCDIFFVFSLCRTRKK
jgi:hypothetical protein